MTMTDADELAAYVRLHFRSTIGDATDPEEIGRLLVARSSSGPRLWAGLRILKSLGVLVDRDDAGRPS